MGARSRYALAAVAAGLYGAALVLPAFTLVGLQMPGYRALELSWAALTEPDGNVIGWLLWASAWAANPFILVAVALTLAGRRTWCRATATTATILCAATGFLFDGLIVYHPGFWVWAASAAVLAVGSWLGWPVAPPAGRQPAPVT